MEVHGTGDTPREEEDIGVSSSALVMEVALVVVIASGIARARAERVAGRSLEEGAPAEKCPRFFIDLVSGSLLFFFFK